MKLVIIFFAFTLSLPLGAKAFDVTGAKKYDFIENQDFNKSVTQFKAKYKNLMTPNQCSQSVAQHCTEKLKVACSCYKVMLDIDNGWSRTLYVTANGERVDELSEQTGAATGLIPRVMKKTSSYFGDQHPDEIHAGGTSFGYRLFTLYWETGDTLGMGITYCPVGTNGKLNGLLRNCYVKSAYITKIQNPKNRAGAISNAEY